MKLMGMTVVQWLICGIACIGFLFDTFVLLVLTLIVQPALTELLGAKPGSAVFNHWIGMLFYVPAVAGGVFGLLGGSDEVPFLEKKSKRIFRCSRRVFLCNRAQRIFSRLFRRL